MTGTGHLDETGGFQLSEKGPGILNVHRRPLAMSGRSIYDSGNLLKELLLPMTGALENLPKLFRVRRRLQLGLSDANHLDIAGYLKVAVTTLVIDMASDGYLDDAPQFARPVAALQRFIKDPGLTTEITDKKGDSWTALQVQEWYLSRAKAYIEQHHSPHIMAQEVVDLWQSTLDALKHDPQRLVGQLDWVTKRFLLETAGAEATMVQRKKIDLKYHEIGCGYAASMRENGLVMQLVSDEMIMRSIHEPPDQSPARIRGEFIKLWADENQDALASWDQVRLRQGRKQKIVDLNTYRKRVPDDP